MKRAYLLLLATFAATSDASPAWSQSYTGQQLRPLLGAGDPRLQTLEYRPDSVFTLNVQPGMQLTLIFGASEQIESVALGNTEAWTVERGGNGDTLFIASAEGAPMTNMTVISDSRIYSFQLQSGYSGSAYIVQMLYPSLAGEPQPGEPVAIKASGYRVSGDRDIRPQEAYDDGLRTYIRWESYQAIPAVFAIGDSGEETVVNGRMQDGWYVTEHVWHKFIFRLGHDKARAVRRERIE